MGSSKPPEVTQREAPRDDVVAAVPSHQMVSRTAPLREQVYEILESRIIHRDLLPGTRLVETEVAENLGVSRNPVREALYLLQRDGWVDIKRHEGTVVHVPTVEEMVQFFQVRLELERASVRLAAESEQRHDARKLVPLVDRGLAMLRAGDYAAVSRLNSELHAAISAISGNNYLAHICSGLDKRLRWYVTSQMLMLMRKEEPWLEHQQMLEHIEANHPRDAERVMTVHIEATLEAFLNREDESVSFGGSS